MAIRIDLILPPAQLREEVSRLCPDDLGKLQKKVHQLALRQGVRIEYWDHQWGAYHLYEDVPRLYEALIDLNGGAKARLVFRLRLLKDHYNEKFSSPRMEIDATGPGWKGIELFAEYFPEPLPEKEIERLNRFCDVVEELVRGEYDADAARILLDRLLQRESFIPRRPTWKRHCA